MTEKLYYKDAYIKSFSAKIVSVTEEGDAFRVVLDKTAFFPEAGGQTADKGYIGDAEVIDVKEDGDIIVHITSTAPKGDVVECRLDFEERLDKMRCHSAEHIISGIFHKHYGIENTGFHLGHEDVTFDTSKPVTAEMLLFAERLANEAVMRNMPITTVFPDPSELPSLEYRSKLDLTEGVRLVYIGDVDVCACCAPHVAYTGEIGMIKFVDAVTHKGGSRIRMLAGMRAYDYATALSRECTRISIALSAPKTAIADELDRLLDARAALEYKLVGMSKACAAAYAESIQPTDGNLVVCLPDFDIDALRSFVNLASARVGGMLVAVSGDDGAYKYVIHHSSPDLSSMVKNANAALNGKGGGRSPMAQGSFSASLEDIKKYFS